MAIDAISLGTAGMDFGTSGGGGMSVYRNYGKRGAEGQSGVQGTRAANGVQGKGGMLDMSGAEGTNGVQGADGAQGTGGMFGDSKISEEADKKRRFDSYECQTCKNRKYQDGSDDSGVSYQTPTHIDPGAAGAAVRSHEQEHVVRNQAKAKREGNEVVSQSVSIHTAICPECGRLYVSGGTTKTTYRINLDKDSKYSVGMFDPTQGRGEMLDKTA